MTGETDAHAIDTALHQPVSKLDADQYMAEDIDGITESLFGSGNLNFLMLQAGQTNGLISAADPFAAAGGSLFSSMAFASSAAMPSSLSHSGNSFEYGGDDGAGIESAPILAADANPGFYGVQPDADFSAAANMPDGSGMATGRAAPPPPPAATASGDSGSNGAPGASGTDGINGIGGNDGTPGDGTTIINEGDTLIEIDLGDLGDTIINLGDTVITNLGDIITNLGDTVTNIGDVVVNLGDTIIGDTLNIVEIAVTEITNIVTSITDCLTETLTGLAGGGLTIQLDALLSGNSLLGLDIIHGDNVFEIVDHAVDLSPVTSLIGDITGSIGLPLDPGNLILGDLSSTLSLLGGGENEHHAGDTDLGLGGLAIADSVTDLIFNPVEDLIGDVDILTDIGLDLFNTSAIDNAAGDTDVSINLGAALADTGLIPDINIDIPLDPLEAITGDIDLDLGAGLNLLGENAASVVDILAGGSGEDNLLTGIRDTLGEAAADVLPDLQDLLGGEVTDILPDVQGLLGGEVTDILPDVQNLLGGEVTDILPDVQGLLGGEVTDILPDVQDLLGGEVTDILPDVQDLPVGSLFENAGLDLFDPSGTDNAGGDTDLSVGVGISIGGIEIVDTGPLEIPLDPVESILGDIDLEIGAALDILNPGGGVLDTGFSGALEGLNVAGDLLGGLTGGITGGAADGTIGDWTESVIPGGDFLSGADYGLGGLGGLDALGSVLEAPVGNIAEGLGGLLGGAEHSPLGGGLFGGGLFR